MGATSRGPRAGGRAGPVGPIGVAGALVALLVVTVATVVGAGPAPDGFTTVAAEQPCRAVTVIAAAGRGPGSTALDAVADPIVATRADRVAVLRVPPPADATTAAVTRATDALATSVATLARACPDGRFVLLGWSEGARAAGDLAARIGTGAERRVPAGRVLAVGLFGDPARRPAGRTVPGGVPGAGVLGPRSGFGTLEARTIEICAPDDPVCASPGPPRALPEVPASARAAPAHGAYARLPVASNLVATDWAARSLSRMIDALPARPAGSASRATPSRATPSRATPSRTTPSRSSPSPSRSSPSRPSSRPPPAGAAGGLLLDSTVGDLASHFDNSANSGLVEGGDKPAVVPDPLDPSRQAFSFTVPGGAKRSEILPAGAQNFRAGERWFFGYVGSVAPDFPVDASDGFQIVWQLHDGGSNVSPPVALEIEKGQLWLTSGGSDRPDRSLGPVTPGQPIAVQLDVRFEIGGGSVSAWRDGRPVITDWRPPKGTMVDDHDYLKVGLYRSERIGQDGTVLLHELKIGRDLASVSPTPGRDPTAAPDRTPPTTRPTAEPTAEPTPEPTSRPTRAPTRPPAAGPREAAGGPRDVYRQPFSWDSVWNLPLSTAARYEPFDTRAQGLELDTDNISVDPTAPVKQLDADGRSVGVHVAPDLSADGGWNNCSALLVDSPDERTVIQGQPMELSPGGDPSWRFGKPALSLTGPGTAGCHGGSGLSGIGGTVRTGELPGPAPIRHALKLGLNCTSSCSADGGGFRWPATKADSGFAGKYGGRNPQVKMGSLLALPPDADLTGITEPDVRKVAEALRDYGAYVVDETANDRNFLVVETGAEREIPNIDSAQMRQVFGRLAVITNSDEPTPGGGPLDAPRRAPCATPFTDGTGGAPPTCGTGGPGP